MRNTPAQKHLHSRVTLSARRKLYVAIVAATQLMAQQAWAGPEGGQVVGGAGSIDQAGTETIIHQHTQRMALDWQSFDVKANERVQFIQPNSSAVALNRVLSNKGSEILGRIDANGQVFLVNPNGVFFGKDSQINVGGMLASGLSIDPTEFMNGNFTLNSLEGAA
jgi:filamentous hemagglutinin family protein